MIVRSALRSSLAAWREAERRVDRWVSLGALAIAVMAGTLVILLL